MSNPRLKDQQEECQKKVIQWEAATLRKRVKSSNRPIIEIHFFSN